MIVRTANLVLETKEFDRARIAIEQIIARHQGYVASLSVSGAANAARTLSVTLRVPAGQLAAALAELKSLGRVSSESQSGEEITQQYVDLVARLANARNTEKRLSDVLLHRTGKVGEVLEVEREIARVREDIERMEAQRKTFENQVRYATVALQVTEEYQKPLQAGAPSTGTRLWNELADGFRTAVDSVIGFAGLLFRVLPVLLLWTLVLLWPARILWRRFRGASSGY
jgi:hypothetical protein